jgi:hypothetical protein
MGAHGYLNKVNRLIIIYILSANNWISFDGIKSLLY